jgi:hypothetical protein
VSQGSPHSAQRTESGFEVRDDRTPKRGEFLRIADQGDRLANGIHLKGQKFRERQSLVNEQSLVPAHPAASSASQKVSRKGHDFDASIEGATELLVSEHFPAILITNKFVFSCFVLMAGTLMAASPETTPVPGRASTTVRSDRSGRLVRIVVAPPKAPKADPKVASLVEEAARSHRVDPDLIHSVIKVESNYNPYAISPKGAEGLMQLIPATAKRFGVSNSFDPKQNIEAGVKYLRYLQDLFGDDRLALAAYNAGEGAVMKYGWIPPYKETQEYVEKVTRRLEAQRAAKPAAVKAETVQAEPPKEEHPKLEAWVDEQGRLHMRTVSSR